MNYFIWTFRLLLIISLLLFVLLDINLRKIIKSLNTSRQIMKARNLLTALSFVFIATIGLVVVNTWLQFQGALWGTLFNLGVLVAVSSEVKTIFQCKKILFCPDDTIIAEYLDDLSCKLFQEQAVSDAKNAIRRACQLKPREPRYWLRYSLIEEDVNKAKNCVDKAEHLIKEQNLKSDELLSQLEYCKGLLLLENPEDTKLALEYFEKSLNLKYSKDIANFVQNIKENVVLYKNTSDG